MACFRVTESSAPLRVEVLPRAPQPDEVWTPTPTADNGPAPINMQRCVLSNDMKRRNTK